jgi:hypothetical protein
MKDKIKYRLLFKDGLGTETYESIGDARRSALAIIQEHRRPLAVLKQNGYCNPPMYTISQYFLAGLTLAQDAMKKYCNI